MSSKKRFSFFSFFLLYAISAFGALVPDTLISGNRKLFSINEVTVGDAVRSFDILAGTQEARYVVHTFKIVCPAVYKIYLPNSVIVCSAYQQFYDPELKGWVSAIDLSCSSKFIDIDFQVVPCIDIEKVELKEPMVCTEVALSSPHTFFVSESQALTHNFFPIALGITFAFGGGVTLTGIGFGVGALGLGLWRSYKEKKEIKFVQMEQELKKSGSSGPPDDPDEEESECVEKMEDFFAKTVFGKKLAKCVEKTNKVHQGQRVYRVTRKMPGHDLRKGDQIYLDNFHKDHLEVFSKRNRFVKVLNLNGSENVSKTALAGGRRLC